MIDAFFPPFLDPKHPDLVSTMRVILLFTLLLLCHGKPYKPINVMELMKIHDIMQQDNGSDEDDDDDKDDDDDLDNFITDCPFGCQCLRRVVQCSDLGNGCFQLDCLCQGIHNIYHNVYIFNRFGVSAT